MTLEETVTAYSNAEDPNTNTDFKKRQEVLEVREKNQDKRLAKVAKDYHEVINNKIPALHRKDAEN